MPIIQNTGIIFPRFGGEGQWLYLGTILLNLMFKFVFYEHASTEELHATWELASD